MENKMDKLRRALKDDFGEPKKRQKSKASKLKIGNTYKFNFPNGAHTVGRFREIQTYPAVGFAADYIFDYISGDDTLSKIMIGQGLGNMFHLTAELISLVDVEELTGDV